MITKDSPVSVYTLFSSSTGNSIFVSDNTTRFLIDAGFNMKHVNGALASLNASMTDIKDVFITHEHTDHIAALQCICKKYEINVRAVGPTAEKLGVTGVIRSDCSGSIRLGGFTVTPFRLSHDTSFCVGYTVRHESGVSFAEMTDTGCVTEEAKNALAGVDAVILESNYDEQMLINGMYPLELKYRIRSDKGHLSNDQASEFLPYLYRYGTRRILLAHISPENNTPKIAYERASRAASDYGLKELSIDCAARFVPTRLI